MTLQLRPIAATMFLTALAGAADWTAPVEVFHDVNKAISYRAKMSGEYLVIQAAVEPGWHTFCMDNVQRATEKLAGRPSLGGDLPTKIAVRPAGARSVGLPSAGDAGVRAAVPTSKLA